MKKPTTVTLIVHKDDLEAAKWDGNITTYKNDNDLTDQELRDQAIEISDKKSPTNFEIQSIIRNQIVGENIFDDGVELVDKDTGKSNWIFWDLPVRRKLMTELKRGLNQYKAKVFYRTGSNKMIDHATQALNQLNLKTKTKKQQ